MDSITLGNILYIGRAFNNYRRELKLPDSMMPSEMLFISYIYRHPGCTQDQIVKSAGMDKTTVAHRLAKLEDLGYIRREVSAEDARKKLCCTTEKAAYVYPQIHEQYLEFWQQLIDGFSEEERLLLEQMTSRMKDNAGFLIAGQERSSETRQERSSEAGKERSSEAGKERSSEAGKERSSEAGQPSGRKDVPQ